MKIKEWRIIDKEDHEVIKRFRTEDELNDWWFGNVWDDGYNAYMDCGDYDRPILLVKVR